MQRSFSLAQRHLPNGWLGAVSAIALQVATGCAGSSEQGGSEGFCSALNAENACPGTLDVCQQQLTIDDLEYPNCVEDRSAFLGCLAEQKLICPSSGTVYAGATENTGEAYSLGDYVAWYPASCAPTADAWTSCKSCPEALQRVRDAEEWNYWDAATITRCEAKREGFLRCVEQSSPQSCPDTSTLFAGASESITGTEIALSGVTIHTSAACAAEYEEWQNCAYCGDGVGYGKQGLDVGQPCSSSAECANGMSCIFGMCTAPCDNSQGGTNCKGRSFRDGECRNDDDRVTSCSSIIDACVLECDDNTFCEGFQNDGFCPGNGAILATNPESLVEYGVCFFGPCAEGWEGCTPTRPFP
jgi:hypothetical protein